MLLLPLGRGVVWSSACDSGAGVTSGVEGDAGEVATVCVATHVLVAGEGDMPYRQS